MTFFQNMRQAHRDRRDARRTYKATKHLDVHLLRDIGLLEANNGVRGR